MVSAVVVARGGSVRLPGKALLPFGDGTTLIGHKVRTLLSSWTVRKVFVNTDSREIRDAACAEGAVAMDGRDYDGDTREMIADSVRQVPGPVVLWAHPTNPLVTADTYDRAVRAYWAGLEQGYDSLLSVYRVQRHAWFDGCPLNYDPWQERHPLAADCKPVWFQDGAIFLQSKERFEQTRYFFGARPKLFEMPEEEVCDVDVMSDYAKALKTAESNRLAAEHLSILQPS